MSDKQLSQRLKSYRQDSKINQRQLAERLGISVRTLEGWEQGRCPQGYARLALERFIKEEGESK